MHLRCGSHQADMRIRPSSAEKSSVGRSSPKIYIFASATQHPGVYTDGSGSWREVGPHPSVHFRSHVIYHFLCLSNNITTLGCHTISEFCIIDTFHDLHCYSGTARILYHAGEKHGVSLRRSAASLMLYGALTSRTRAKAACYAAMISRARVALGGMPDRPATGLVNMTLVRIRCDSFSIQRLNRHLVASFCRNADLKQGR